MEAKDMFSVLALIVSVVALVLTILQRRRERIEAVVEGLRADRRAVTYAALTIRLSHLLQRDDYRRSLIASLLLAWNFETSDRARAAVLAALVDAKQSHPDDYSAVVSDLVQRFADYERTIPDGDIDRGRNRLNDVTTAVDAAAKVHGQASAPNSTIGKPLVLPGGLSMFDTRI